MYTGYFHLFGLRGRAISKHNTGCAELQRKRPDRYPESDLFAGTIAEALVVGSIPLINDRASDAHRSPEELATNYR
jgi:hypothetical protein